MPLLAGYLSADAASTDESWELRFPFGPVRITVSEGAFHLGDDVDLRPTSHSVEIPDASTWLLEFPYGRRPPADEATARLARQFVAL
jgi:hypothetical protein